MQETLDPTTLIFIALAVFVAWRLRSVLGQKTGQEQPPSDPFRRDRKPAADKDAPAPAAPRKGDANVVRMPGLDRPPVPAGNPWAGIAEPDTPMAKALDAVAAAEPGFDAPGFVEGSKMAYEMIVLAFAGGDRKALKDLLSKDVYEGFEAEISRREKDGHKVQTTFVSIDRAKIVSVDVRGRVAQITVDFASKLITATRDESGAVIDGDAGGVVDVNDIWTFARTLGSRDPNWQLVATESGQ